MAATSTKSAFCALRGLHEISIKLSYTSSTLKQGLRTIGLTGYIGPLKTKPYSVRQ